MSSAPSDRSAGDSLVEQLAARFGPARSITPLAPDASTRAFFRLERPDGARLVAMVDKSGGPGGLSRMVAARDLLGAVGVRVPRIEDRDDKISALLLEDLGDLLLADALPRLSREEQLKLYAEAGRFAGLISKDGTATVGRGHPLEFPSLSRSKLRSELALFTVQDIAGRRRRDEQELLRAFSDLADRICEVLGAAPPALAHRDFHARNLLVLPGPRLGVVDFQDTLLAPPLYDLASLTHDPYVEPDAELTRTATTAFACTAGTDGEPLDDPLFPWVVLQRVLKAIGTYAFQARVKKRARFLSFIPTAERLALRAAERLPEESRASVRTLLLQLGFEGPGSAGPASGASL